MNDTILQGHSRRFLAVQAVTLARIPLAVAFAITLLAFEYTEALAIACLLLLLLAELTDLLDGFLARRMGVVTRWGALLDPYADSVARLIVYWALAKAGLAIAILPLAMACRDLTVAYCRIIWVGLGESGSARLSGKIKAVVQGTGACLLAMGPTLEQFTGPLTGELISGFILLVTVGSGVDYVAQTRWAIMKHGKSSMNLFH